MIVPMAKTFVAVRRADREALLAALGRLGVLHVQPVDPHRAAPDPAAVETLDRLRRAVQVLETVEPEGPAPDLSPEAAAEEVLRLQGTEAELQARLAALHRQVEHLRPWGDVRLEQFRALAEAGIEVRFFAVAEGEVDQVEAECVEPLGEFGPRRRLVAVIQRRGEPTLPPSAEPVPLPPRDRPSLLAEAKETDEALRRGRERLRRLAGLLEAMRGAVRRLEADVEWTRTLASALEEADLFAIQGWVPAERAEALAEDLRRAGIEAAVRFAPPAEDDEPPTLIRYPRWARPIQGLFDILGTLPGYREMDLSPFFMVALPLFAAMLIGDAGYGLLLVLVGGLFYGRLVRKAGRPKTHLLLIVGLATLVWGVLTANYFGVTPETLARAGGYVRQQEDRLVADYAALAAGTDGWARAARLMMAPAVAWDPDPKAARFLLMKISFVIGAAHLILAHLRKAADYVPDPRCLAELGWCGVLGGMLVLIWHLVFIGVHQTPLWVAWIIAGGLALPVLFGSPHRNPLKRVGVGLASSLLPLLGTFSDTMSYVRLMAVGLASYYIASAFNGLAASLAGVVTWFGVLPELVLVFGHGLNLGLAAIAIFAHGVRLNMLEFSNNAGVQWAGYPYAPFATARNHKE